MKISKKTVWKLVIGFPNKVDQGWVLWTTKISEFWLKYQIFENFHRFLNCVLFKIFWKGIFRYLSSQLHQNTLLGNFSDFLKNWWVQNFKILFRKIFRTQIILDRLKPCFETIYQFSGYVGFGAFVRYLDCPLFRSYESFYIAYVCYPLNPSAYR